MTSNYLKTFLLENISMSWKIDKGEIPQKLLYFSRYAVIIYFSIHWKIEHAVGRELLHT